MRRAARGAECEGAGSGGQSARARGVRVRREVAALTRREVGAHAGFARNDAIPLHDVLRACAKRVREAGCVIGHVLGCGFAGRRTVWRELRLGHETVRVILRAAGWEFGRVPNQCAVQLVGARLAPRLALLLQPPSRDPHARARVLSEYRHGL